MHLMEVILRTDSLVTLFGFQWLHVIISTHVLVATECTKLWPSLWLYIGL